MRIFVSHAGKDRVVAGRLHAWMTGAGHEVFLAADALDGVAGGEAWRERLYTELRAADAVVCVVTGAYAESLWCSIEIALAEALGCRLLPVRAQAGVAHPMLEPSRVQYLDYAADEVGTRTRLVGALRRWQAGGRTRIPDGGNPYPGLEAFTGGRKQVFFGRDTEIGQLRKQVTAAARPDGAGLLVLTGRSGCGKSSLLRAGLLPVLVEDPAWLVTEVFIPGADPAGSLARSLAATASAAGLDPHVWSASAVRARLLPATGNDGNQGNGASEAGEAGGLGVVAADLLAAVGGSDRRRLLLPVDQAEELLAPTLEGRGLWLVTAVAEAITDGLVRVVATARADFVDDLLGLPALAAVRAETFPVRPLPAGLLPVVITGPARVAGLVVEEELTGRLVADTGTGQGLPLLAFTLHQLAEGLGRGERLSAARYEQLGGVGGALTGHADTALRAAAQAGGLTETEVLAGLTRLVSIDGEGRRARRRVPVDRLPAPLRTAIGVLVQARLLDLDTPSHPDDHSTGADGEGGDTPGADDSPGVDVAGVRVGLTHEALLTVWDTFDSVLTARAGTLRAVRAVGLAAGDWQTAGRDQALVWDRRRVEATLAALGLPPGIQAETVTAAAQEGDLSPEAGAFLTASATHARHQQELAAHRDQRDRRARARTLTVLSGLLVLALIAAGVAFVQRQAAVTAQRVSAARALNAGAETLRDTDGRLAIQLDTAAVALNPGTETRDHLATTLLTSVPSTPPLTGHTDTVLSVAFAPDGHTLASGSDDNTVRLWDVSDRARPRPLGTPLTGHTGPVYSVAFAPDGHTLASGSDDGTVRLWDVTDRARPRPLGTPLTGPTGPVWSVAFAPDGHTLASGSDDGTVRLWDVSDRARARPLGTPLTGHTDTVSSVAFAPDGHTLASASFDHTVRLWDVTDRARPRPLGTPLTGHTGPVWSVAFAPDGHTLASGSDDGTVRLWDVTDRARPRPLGTPLTGPTGSVWSVAFAPDGHTLASGSADGTVRLWDVSDRARPRPLGTPLTGHTSAVLSVAFAPDGHTLASASVDDTVRLWDVTDRARPRPLGTPLTGHTGPVYSVAFAPDGHTLATGSADHTVRLWDVTDPARPRPLGTPLTGHTGPVWSVAFAPDGHTLASGSDDSTVRLWDVSDRARARPLGTPLTGHTDTVSSVAFAPDGHTLATGSDDHTVRLWDVSGLSALVAAPLKEACQRVPDPPDHATWQFYAPGLPLPHPCR